MQFSHFRDRRLLFQDSTGADSTELSSSPTTTTTPALGQAAATTTTAPTTTTTTTVIYPSTGGGPKQMVKMSDLGTALQKETITIKREENGEMVASVMTPSSKMSDLGAALQKETITIKREENGEMVASVGSTSSSSKMSFLSGGTIASVTSGADASSRASAAGSLLGGPNGNNITGTITTGNILASLGGLGGATSIKFSFASPTTATAAVDVGGGGGVGGGGNTAGAASHVQPTMTQFPLAKVVPI